MLRSFSNVIAEKSLKEDAKDSRLIDFRPGVNVAYRVLEGADDYFSLL